MANVSVYDITGNEVSSLDLNDSIFGADVNENLMHKAVVLQLANKRQGTQKAKTRSEVSGGGKKPWRQKGTGNARQGSTRSPQWRGGGVVFAPVPRDYSFKMNRKEKQGAIKSALSSRVNEEKFVVIDSIAFDEAKTKNVANMVKAFKDKEIVKTHKALIVLEGMSKEERGVLAKGAESIEDVQKVVDAVESRKEKNGVVQLAARNIPDVRTISSDELSVYDILKYDTVIIEKEAVAKIEEAYA
ncbi:MAG: 50S ribosomal protein L4 [Lachnospiraceae bacterium]|nr:50S ribosomal protein L4 [Lachnospiraceae bacterium]